MIEASFLPTGRSPERIAATGSHMKQTDRVRAARLGKVSGFRIFDSASTATDPLYGIGKQLP